MSVIDVFDKRVVDLNMNVKDKTEAIYHLSNLLKEAGYIHNIDEFVTDIYTRENGGITGIGEGVAIPHGKSEAVLNIGIAIGKLNEMIEWESLDKKPVNVIFLFAVSKNTYDREHLKLLGELAARLGRKNTINKLRKMKTFEDLIDAFKDEISEINKDMEEMVEDIEIIIE